MRYLSLPEVGNVSRVALGTAHYGREIPEETAFEEMDAFLECGGNLIDTAHFYGQTEDGGPSMTEITIGKWLNADKRRKIVLATKGGFPHIGHKDRPRLDRDSLLYDMKASLDHLGTAPDIYFLHRDDPAAEVGPMIETLNFFVESGWTKLIGASNWSEQRIEEANSYASSHGMKGFTISQLQFSLHKATKKMLDDETIEILGTSSSLSWYERNDFPFMAYSPLMKGLFQKILDGRDDSVSDDMRARYIDEVNNKRIARAAEICRKNGLTPSELMFAYILSQKAPSIAIAASTKPEHIRQMAMTSEIILSQEDIDYLTGGENI